jgi:hypothetical protein
VENSARGYAASSSPKTRSAHTLTLKSWLLDFTPVFRWNSSSDMVPFELRIHDTPGRVGVWPMKRSIFVAAPVLALMSCQTKDKGPVGVVQAYAEVSNRRDCETMWSLLTANSRSAIEAGHELTLPGNSLEPHFPGRKPGLSSQKQFFCSWAFTSDSESAKLISLDANTARVSVLEEVPTGFLIPGFWPTSHFCREWQLPLIKENEGWRIDYVHLRRPFVSSSTPCRK